MRRGQEEDARDYSFKFKKAEHEEAKEGMNV
jgi:hypothetical protein